MRVYLDNAATTRPLEAAIEKSNKIHDRCYGNPSSLHGMGLEAELEINEAAKDIAAICGCSKDEVYFNSGGTEGDNTAVFGVAKAHARKGKHLITTAGEHPAVARPMKVLEEQGFEITVLGVDDRGYVSLDELASAIRRDTIMISIHHVNSETGTVQDINALAAAAKSENPDIVFHSDGVQAFGKLEPDLRDIDLYTISAHKLHAFKGTGALLVKKGMRPAPLLYGGEQQSGLRSGTENVAGIAAFALSAKEFAKNTEKYRRHVKSLKERLAEIKEDIPGLYINGDEDNGSPYILNMSFTGIRAEVLLHALEDKGIYVSTGSACSSKKQKNRLPVGLGIGPERVESAVRFSLSALNTHDEIDYCLSVLKKTIPVLRR